MSTAAPTRPTTRSFRVQPWWVFFFGVVVVPLLLTVALTSHGSLTDEGAVRMAFGTVAGATVAIVSAWTSLGLVIACRERRWVIAWHSLLALAVTAWSIGGMASAADTLLFRLGLQ